MLSELKNTYFYVGDYLWELPQKPFFKPIFAYCEQLSSFPVFKAVYLKVTKYSNFLMLYFFPSKKGIEWKYFLENDQIKSGFEYRFLCRVLEELENLESPDHYVTHLTHER